MAIALRMALFSILLGAVKSFQSPASLSSCVYAIQRPRGVTFRSRCMATTTRMRAENNNGKINFAGLMLTLQVLKRAEETTNEGTEKPQGAVDQLNAAKAAAYAELRRAIGVLEGRAAQQAPDPLVKVQPGTIIGAKVLKQPEYVAIDSEGRIIVTDSALHQVVVFNRNGSVARRIGSKGSAVGQFNQPMGVAVDRQGRIVVADTRNYRIQVLNPDGSVMHCFRSTDTNSDRGLTRPCRVAIDTKGHIYVAEFGKSRVNVYNADGFLVHCLGSVGAVVDQSKGPSMGLALDGAGRIVVADTCNHRVQVFNGDGSVALCFGSPGEGLGQLYSPYGVAVDKEGRFIVADTGNHRVQVFNSDGSLARVINVGHFSPPIGVVVDGAGRIVVVGINRRVLVL